MTGGVVQGQVDLEPLKICTGQAMVPGDFFGALGREHRVKPFVGMVRCQHQWPAVVNAGYARVTSGGQDHKAAPLVRCISTMDVG